MSIQIAWICSRSVVYAGCDLPLASEARKQFKDTLFRNPLAPVFAHHEELCHGIDTLVRLTDFSDQSEPGERRTARSA